MALGKDEIPDLYHKRAKYHDVNANLCHLIDFRRAGYRAFDISLLEPRSGDTLVEIGYGTGLNIGYELQSLVTTGRLIGVDHYE